MVQQRQPLRADDSTEEETDHTSSEGEPQEGEQSWGPILRRKPTKKRLQSDESSAETVWGDHKSAWDSLKGVKPGDEVIFGHIEIAKDGGLGEISLGTGKEGEEDRLWYGTRPLSALITIVFVLYNFYFIMDNAKTVIYGHEVSWGNFTFDKLSEVWDGTANEKKDYLVSTYLVGEFLTAIHPNTEWDAMLSSFVVILEVVMLLTYVFFWTFSRLLQAAFFSVLCCDCVGNQQWKRWFYITEVFFYTIPQLTSFSAMKLLYYIVPQVATQHLFEILFYIEGRKMLNLFWFVISRAFCLVVGLDCFLIKYRGVEYAILNQPDFHFWNVLNAIIFLNQVLGVVQLRWAIRDRLYRFVFAGEDGIMTKSETIRRDIWEARVVQRICRTYPCWKAVSILMTWNDDDFQTLVLQDVPESGQPAGVEASSVRVVQRLPAVVQGVLVPVEAPAAYSPGGPVIPVLLEAPAAYSPGGPVIV